jgi:chaperonin GroEL (HSP60 family)
LREGAAWRTAIADAARVTLGSRSKCVLIEKKWGKNLGARMLRDAAERTGDAVGDGTMSRKGQRASRRLRSYQRTA